MKSDDNLQGIADFIGEYATCLLGAGVHTSRVLRNTSRIAVALGVKVRMTTFQKTIILSVFYHEDEEVLTEVVDIPALPINFEYNSELSSLSWDAVDKSLSLPELREEYNRIVSKPKMNPHLLLLLVGLANGAFCRLFGGTWPAVGIVIVATLAGFFARQQMQYKKMNHFVVFTISAFVASICASGSLFLLNDQAAAQIAIATSVLYLIPGVPLINGVIDIVEGHTLTGFSRLIQAFLLIICLAVGLSASLLIFKNGLLW